MRNFIDIITEATLEEVNLEEAGAGASRIVSHIRKGTPFFVITAMRANLPAEMNAKRTDALKDYLAQMPGLSFIDVTGEYQEEGQDEPSQEISFFVMPRSSNSSMKTFHAIARKLMKTFDQESILVGDGKTVSLQYGDHQDEIGTTATFDPSVIGQLGGYSVVKSKKFSFTTPDVAPRGVEYGSDKKTA